MLMTRTLVGACNPDDVTPNRCPQGFTGGNCSVEVPCGAHPGTCDLKPGQPPQYKPICVAQTSAAACEKVGVTCSWAPSTAAGRPCANTYTVADLTGLWTGYGAQAKAMFWAQPLAPGDPSAAAAQCSPSSGPCYSIQCLTGNYSELPQDGVRQLRFSPQNKNGVFGEALAFYQSSPAPPCSGLYAVRIGC